mmetsp:Transcript_10193/g.36259  ORF Transcript_10193/g.36259 Transcript_10193/m.36259 type:complete len:260 (-) Transcript_10193:21-800(-)
MGAHLGDGSDLVDCRGVLRQYARVGRNRRYNMRPRLVYYDLLSVLCPRTAVVDLVQDEVLGRVHGDGDVALGPRGRPKVRLWHEKRLGRFQPPRVVCWVAGLLADAALWVPGDQDRREDRPPHRERPPGRGRHRSRSTPGARVPLSLSLSLAIKDIPWETLGPRAPQKAIRRTKKEVVRSKRGMKEFGVVVCSAAGSWNGTPMIKVHSTLFTRITKNKPHHHPFVLFACVRGRQTIERGKGSAASSGGSRRIGEGCFLA